MIGQLYVKIQECSYGGLHHHRKFERHTHLVAGIKGTFARNISILCVCDIMAYSQLSGDDVVSTIFADKEGNNDSENRQDIWIYGYLGAREELMEEAHSLIRNDRESEDDPL